MTRAPQRPRLPGTNSLAFRLIASAAVWSLFGLVVGGLVLSALFRSSVETSFDARLRFDLEGLVAAAEPDRLGGVSLEDRFSDPRFERVYSGWYWQIVPEERIGTEGKVWQTSRSLFDKTIDIVPFAGGAAHAAGYAEGPDGQHLRILEQRIVLAAAEGGEEAEPRAYHFVVAGSLEEVENEIGRFNRTLVWSFAALGLGLVAAMFVQVRVGLLPLRRVSEALSRIRAGRARRLEGDFPDEIAPLADELNSLIEHSAEVVGRARTHVSNLAHVLKTPLTILANEAGAQGGEFGELVARQVAAMRRQVDHYLARARAAGAMDVLGSRTPVGPVLDDLVRILRQMHAERAPDIVVHCADDLAFRGERQDFEEMAGNLIDNACKWAKGAIRIAAAPGEGRTFTVSVADDGPGLSDAERARAVERGERLDESVPGSGLGLAIVRDIAKLYGGNLELAASPLGGLEARLTLPAAS